MPLVNHRFIILSYLYFDERSNELCVGKALLLLSVTKTFVSFVSSEATFWKICLQVSICLFLAEQFNIFNTRIMRRVAFARFASATARERPAAGERPISARARTEAGCDAGSFWIQSGKKHTWTALRQTRRSSSLDQTPCPALFAEMKTRG